MSEQRSHTCCDVWCGDHMSGPCLDSLTAPCCCNPLHCRLLEATCVLQVPVLIAIDDYNLLHSHTEFYEAASTFHRRQIPPEEIQLAAALRVLSVGEPPKRCAYSVVHRTGCLVGICSRSLETCLLHGCRGLFIGAATSGGRISPKLQPPVQGDWRMECSGFSHQEAMAYANYHTIQVGIPQLHLHLHLQLVTVDDDKPTGAPVFS